MDKAAAFLEDCNAGDTESHEGKNNVNAKFASLCKRLSWLRSYSVETNTSNEYWTDTEYWKGKCVLGNSKRGKVVKLVRR